MIVKCILPPYCLKHTLNTHINVTPKVQNYNNYLIILKLILEYKRVLIMNISNNISQVRI